MPSTRDNSTRAAAFVMISLLVALVGGLALYLAYAEPLATGVPLLAGCALVAFGFAVLAVRITMGYRKSRRLESEHGVRPSRVLRALELRQWLILTVGLAFLASATGAATGLRVLSADAATPPAAAQPTTPAPYTEPTTEFTPEPTEEPSPSDSPSPTDSLDPAQSPDDTPATKYLDVAGPLDGYFDAEPVVFSAERHPRGIAFRCESMTSTFIQWNVAGYRTFTAVAGIDDRATDAFGRVVEIIFYDEDGRQLTPKPVEVSVGHPRDISLDLNDVVSLRMACASRDSKTNTQRNTRTAFGDPVVLQ